MTLRVVALSVRPTISKRSSGFTGMDWDSSNYAISRITRDLMACIDMFKSTSVEGCRLRDDIPQLPCCVFRYENMKEEAQMFIVANRARKPINRLDDYYAALAAADEDAIEVEQMVKAAGFSISRSTSSAAWRPGEIAFTSGLSKAIRRFGTASFRDSSSFPLNRLQHLQAFESHNNQSPPLEFYRQVYRRNVLLDADSRR